MTTPAIDTIRRLRHFHDGILRLGERIELVRFVFDPATGAPVLPVGHDVFELGYEFLTLHVPDDDDDSIHLMGHAVELDPARDAPCDRYLFYFGKPAPTRWMRLVVDSVKHRGEILSGEEVCLPSPIQAAEPRLVKAANADEHILTRAVAARKGVTPTQPRVVGVDAWGMDVRARFGVVRVEFAAAASDEAGAIEQIQAILESR